MIGGDDLIVIESEILEVVHEELRRHFEPFIRDTQSLPEVGACASITLRLIRLAKATRLLC